MADEAQVLAEAKQLCLADQLAHSSWKVRAQALTTIQERVARAFSSEDDVFAEAGACCWVPGGELSDALRGRETPSTPPPADLPPAPVAPTGPLLAKAVGDSNANVMDKAVETLVTYLEKADEGQAAR